MYAFLGLNDWIGLHLFNDDTRPSGHISHPRTQWVNNFINGRGRITIMTLMLFLWQCYFDICHKASCPVIYFFMGFWIVIYEWKVTLLIPTGTLCLIQYDEIWATGSPESSCNMCSSHLGMLASKPDGGQASMGWWMYMSRPRQWICFSHSWVGLVKMMAIIITTMIYIRTERIVI